MNLISDSDRVLDIAEIADVQFAIDGHIEQRKVAVIYI
jgi:hypothetical protein